MRLDPADAGYSTAADRKQTTERIGAHINAAKTRQTMLKRLDAARPKKANHASGGSINPAYKVT